MGIFSKKTQEGEWEKDLNPKGIKSSPRHNVVRMESNEKEGQKGLSETSRDLNQYKGTDKEMRRVVKPKTRPKPISGILHRIKCRNERKNQEKGEE